MRPKSDRAKRFFVNTRPPDEHAGILAVTSGRAYTAHIVHCSYAFTNGPSHGQRSSHAHDVYHILLVTQGHGHFVLDGTVHPVSAGHLYLTSPGQPHGFGNYGEDDAVYSEVTFEFRDKQGHALTTPFHELVTAWTGRPCLAVARAVVDSELHFRLARRIEGMVKTGFEQAPDFNLTLNSELAQLMLDLYLSVFRQEHVQPPEKMDPLERVRGYLERHYAEPLSLEQLGAMAGLSANYLSHRFKAKYHVTPIRYQQRLRMNAAASLLRATDHPIKQIGQIVGYPDVYFFSRMFKKSVGSPPARYRAAHLQPAQANSPGN